MVLAAAVGLSVIAGGEVVHARAARRAAKLPLPAPGSRLVVVVLGFGNRGTRINMVNRWRARIAVRTAGRARAAGASASILCSGGAVRGPIAEATLLRDHITAALGWDGDVSVEADSTSTWENVPNAGPWIDAADQVAFASNGLHAEKARTYFRRQYPDRAAALVSAEDHRFGEMALVKPIFAAVGLWKLRAVFHVEHRR